MLEWLKTILGDTYTEEIDKKVSEEIGKGFVARSDFNTANEAKKQLETQIADRDKQLADIKKQSGDAATLKAALEKAEADNKTATEAHKAEMAKLQKTTALQVALAEKAHDPDDIIKLLDLNSIELDGTGKLKTGVDDLVKPFKEQKPYLFKEDKVEKKPDFQIKGVTPMAGADQHQGGNEDGTEFNFNFTPVRPIPKKE